jgi:tetratricopeptide (TPR) repeat protein
MIDAPNLEMDFPLATDGDIAVINLESAREQSWSRFWGEPQRPGIAECIVEQEQLTAQFLGDMGALDRLDVLTNQLARVDPESGRTALINAQVASMAHRFAEANSYLAQFEAVGPLAAAANRLSLCIDQACGTRLERVLEARRRMAAESGRLEDLVPLGALLADLGEFDEADRIYHLALGEYNGVSPFAPAWVCFQLGVLWGELVLETQSIRAAQWYRKAMEFLPCYVKARVHLAEIYSECGRAGDAEVLLVPAVSSGDPEVHWRLADVMVAMGRLKDAEVQMETARSGFEFLLGKHLLAFADHGAEFYSGSGNDAGRAFELASINLANRPTIRAFELAYATAIGAGKSDGASEIIAAAEKRWGSTVALGVSSLAPGRCHCDSQQAERT